MIEPSTGMHQGHVGGNKGRPGGAVGDLVEELRGVVLAAAKEGSGLGNSMREALASVGRADGEATRKLLQRQLDVAVDLVDAMRESSETEDL